MKIKCTAFQYLQQLDDQAAAENKQTLLRQEPYSHDWLGLTFSSYTRLYATKINFIEAVIPVGKIYSLPSPSPSLLGTSHYQNQLFTVIDLKHILWHQKSTLGPTSRIIIYRYYDFWFGLLICASGGLKRFKDNHIMSSIPHDSLVQNHFIKKIIHEKEQHWALLDIGQIISELNNRDLFLSQPANWNHENKK